MKINNKFLTPNQKFETRVILARQNHTMPI